MHRCLVRTYIHRYVCTYIFYEDILRNRNELVIVGIRWYLSSHLVFLCVCVSVCECECVRACVCLCVCVCVNPMMPNNCHSARTPAHRHTRTHTASACDGSCCRVRASALPRQVDATPLGRVQGACGGVGGAAHARRRREREERVRVRRSVALFQKRSACASPQWPTGTGSMHTHMHTYTHARARNTDAPALSRTVLTTCAHRALTHARTHRRHTRQ